MTLKPLNSWSIEPYDHLLLAAFTLMSAVEHYAQVLWHIAHSTGAGVAPSQILSP
jgi:hypothetical protein